MLGGGEEYLAIMLFTIINNWIGGIVIGKLDEKQRIKLKKLALFITILINLLILGYFKYFNFILSEINHLFSTNIDFIAIALPIGISFYTFQAISYVIDVYRKEVKPQLNFYKLALYISLFPQLVAGPIVKYHDVSDEIEHRSVNINDVSYGAKRFIIGLAKKVLLANTFGKIADLIFSQPTNQFSFEIAWLGAISYSLQIFFDFSGYSDMAIGLGRIFGFHFKENFNFPYISKAISEFWRRWHISLSTWFKEYIYIPLGGNRKGSVRTYINLSIVFLITGIWHGAAWTYIVWGIYNGFFILIEKYLNLSKEGDWSRLKRLSLHCYFLLVLIIGWVLFRSPNLEYACSYVATMFNFISPTNNVFTWFYYIDHIEIITFLIAIPLCTPLVKKIMQKIESNSWGVWIYNAWLYILLILSTSSIASGAYNPFIYFQF